MTLNTPCIDHGRTRSLSPAGYAYAWWQGKSSRLHRIEFCKAKGLNLSDIEGQMVLHSCDNTRCINVEHLRLGTHEDNMRDCAERRRAAGLKLTPEQVADIRATFQPSDKRGRGNTNPNGLKGLSRKHGVSHSAIRAVVQRETFKHLP